MPKRQDLKTILLIGSGPIMIGQACEFDYSGTQAVKALREEGYRVILMNSNPATIMTDPELSDRVYLEPLTAEFVEKIILEEKPQALLPTMGGQTALNLTMELHRSGILSRHGVEILGATPEAIFKAEDRSAFKAAMSEIGVESARSRVVRTREEGVAVVRELGLPLILRPSFTLGGEGGGISRSETEFFEKLERALFLSPSHDVLVEESLLGWKEFELEVVRDRKDNVIIVCSIENFDPMGVHTGDSITVAPAQTLTDREYQNLRDQSVRIIRAIGVETGGANIQFAVHPKTGRILVIEMNPRVSRSSALASKATGFPIARVAAKLAIGYTLDELTNDITGTTPCSFEPSIDYVVTKLPRFDFEKFRPTESTLGTQMKSVGEVMAIGRSFEESFGKALAGLEVNRPWLSSQFKGHLKGKRDDQLNDQKEVLWKKIEIGNPDRIWAIADAIRLGVSLKEIAQRSAIDPWFLSRLAHYLEGEKVLQEETWPLPKMQLLSLKSKGWTDFAIADVVGISEVQVRETRESLEVFPVFEAVDTCAAEFEAKTPYLYSTYPLMSMTSLNRSNAAQVKGAKKSKQSVLILGGGPNRIGQGIEFDYCCVHAAMALRALGLETIMVNSNPETVSTDFDISDKLYFEPLTTEHILNICKEESPLGVIVQFGGQTPLKLARGLEQAGVRILGTSPSSIDLAEDRGKCEELVRDLRILGLEQPPATTANSSSEMVEKANQLGYPILVRPSYVLGGKSMRIIYGEGMLRKWLKDEVSVDFQHPVLMDRFLDRATEVDIDAISDGREAFIGGLMEHIEEAGIHSGDSACSLPSVTLSVAITDRIRTYTRELAKKLKVIGLMNAQFAIQGDRIFLLEVNPRASRTVPFVSKAVGRPLAKLAVQVMMGRSLHDLGIKEDLDLHLSTFNVKVPVFPFHKFPGVDVLLGPEMKSTGEVMGRGRAFASAYAKGVAAAGIRLPDGGDVFLSIRDEDKAEVLSIARELKELGFTLWATGGTEVFLNRYSLDVKKINKVYEGSPHCVEMIQKNQFVLVINTVSSEAAIRDSYSMRRAALERKISYTTVLSAARAMVQGIREQKKGLLEVFPL